MSKISKNVCRIITLLLTVGLGALMGFLLCSAMFSGFFNGTDIILCFLGIAVTLYISIIIHEAGHMIFGLMCGYSFSSFRVGSLMWVKQNGKIHLRRMSVAGTGGQCLMLPPEPKDGKFPVILYNLGGVIANIVLSALFAIGYALTLRYIVVAFVFLIATIISFIMALTNGIPLNVGGIANDGMNALHLSKDKISALAFRNQLLMNAAQTEGKRISEMPDEWFEIPENADTQNVHIASIAVFAAGRVLDRGDTILAEKEITQLLNSRYNVIGLHRSLLTCDLIYCRLVNGSASVQSLITPELRKFMSAMKNYPSILRTEYAIALLVDKDEKKAESIMVKFDQQSKKFPYPQEISAERDFMLRAMDTYKKVN
ncbi:MAG: M50 family metallopeptidase [Clostridia bacterium]|nr:M50 family metallopeptidase [Clostridia bacterium]